MSETAEKQPKSSKEPNQRQRLILGKAAAAARTNVAAAALVRWQEAKSLSVLASEEEGLRTVPGLGRHWLATAGTVDGLGA